MVENRPFFTVLTHIIMILGLAIVLFPIYIAFVASTHEARDVLSTVQGWFGGNLIDNYTTILKSGKATTGGIPVGHMMWNSFIMAIGIVFGKISISLISAYAIVYFRFRFRMFFFWIIFMTLMLPVEVRILPTYHVVASLGLLNTYTGLTLPLIASATATFLFRQFFLTVPDELTEAARVDGASPLDLVHGGRAGAHADTHASGAPTLASRSERVFQLGEGPLHKSIVSGIEFAECVPQRGDVGVDGSADGLEGRTGRRRR